MMRIYICSPYRGSQRIRNVTYARAIGERVINAGHMPIAPHLYYPQFRATDELGRELALRDLASCAAILICDLYGISEGMQREIEEAKTLNIPSLVVANEDAVGETLKYSVIKPKPDDDFELPDKTQCKFENHDCCQ